MTTIDKHEFQPAGMESSPEEESLYRFRKGSYILYITLAAESRLLKDPIDYGFRSSFDVCSRQPLIQLTIT
jgi:hypothetical protein